jgi:periplasmic divalent cation tolerance protein
MHELIIAYIPSPSHEAAHTIALHLLENKLIAYANIIPCSGVWHDNSYNRVEQEHILMVKTLPSRAYDLEKEVKKLHPHQMPCMVKYSTRASEQYYRWVSHEISPRESH